MDLQSCLATRIMAELGACDLACRGHPQVKTPHLDCLAGEGAESYQFTVCSPVSSPRSIDQVGNGKVTAAEFIRSWFDRQG